MGVLNVTPDSFSDGGHHVGADAAIEHGRALAADGAHIIDIGGESTRPGADPVDVETELARVLPVVTQLARDGFTVSIDTMHAAVAEAAIRAGATLVNDVSGGLVDPAMAGVVAETGVDWVLMHWRAPSDVMANHAIYTDVVTDVCAELSDRVEAALDAGVDRDRIILDPGLGFAKTHEHNWDLLRRLDVLFSLGFPVLIGASRKSFLGAALERDGVVPPPVERDAATLAVSMFAAQAGAWGVRVHDVRSTSDAFAVQHRLHTVIE